MQARSVKYRKVTAKVKEVIAIRTPLLCTVRSVQGLAQYGYDGHRYTSYDAFATALHNISYQVEPGCTIGFPKNIGCGLGGGNWKVISALIEEILGKDFEVYIYEYEGE
jgi:hypothetical protein